METFLCEGGGGGGGVGQELQVPLRPGWYQVHKVWNCYSLNTVILFVPLHGY